MVTKVPPSIGPLSGLICMQSVRITKSETGERSNEEKHPATPSFFSFPFFFLNHFSATHLGVDDNGVEAIGFGFEPAN